MDLKIIGENIRKIREFKKIPREVMAAELEMSLSGYARVERGEVDLTVRRLDQISKLLQAELTQVLNLDASHIFNNSNNGTIQDNGAIQVINHHHTADEIKDKYISKLEEEICRLKRDSKNKENDSSLL